MIGSLYRETIVAKALVLGVWFILLATVSAGTASAHAPDDVGRVEEAGLLPIWIFDQEDELDQLHKFVIEDNDLRGYSKGMVEEKVEFQLGGETYRAPDGSLAVCEAVVYRVIQLAISQLWPEGVPVRADFGATWRHPDTGHEGTFRYILGDAATLNKDIVDGTTDKDFTLDAYQYSFTNLDTGDTFEARVKDGVFPDGFFELRTKVKTEQAAEAEEARFSQMWERARDSFIEMEDDQLFDFDEEEEQEKMPIGQMAFAFGLLATVLGATVYSFVSGRARKALK